MLFVLLYLIGVLGTWLLIIVRSGPPEHWIGIPVQGVLSLCWPTVIPLIILCSIKD